MTKYNKTQLNPQDTFERHIYHRDQFAHYLRWTHILKIAKIGQTILDFGCGSGEMLEVFYRNRFRPKKYLGLDIRTNTINKNNEKFKNVDFAEFKEADLCGDINLNEKFDIITSFEVFEHIGKWNGQKYLNNIKKHMNENSRLYMSTPCFNGKAAKNHMITDDEGNEHVGEYGFEELKELLSKNFEIIKVYGTFASMSDYKPLLNDWQQKMFDELCDYYDVNLVSNIMAPFFPEHSRNAHWVLKLKEDKNIDEEVIDKETEEPSTEDNNEDIGDLPKKTKRHKRNRNNGDD